MIECMLNDAPPRLRGEATAPILRLEMDPKFKRIFSVTSQAGATNVRVVVEAKNRPNTVCGACARFGFPVPGAGLPALVLAVLG